MTDREEDIKEKLTELTKSSGVEGAERLAALFLKKHGDLARTMSMTKIKGLSNEVLKRGPGKQILAYPQNLSGGRIHASSPNEVWQADTASMFTFGGGYFLCVVDVFTRRTWAEQMASATPGEVKRVLQSIGEKPRILDTDLGNEFKGELQPYLKDQGIAHRTKDPKDLNALAVCDRKIQQIKKAISSMQMEQKKGWKELLPNVVKGINESPTEGALGRAPEDVRDNELAIFDLQKANAAKAEETEKNRRSRSKRYLRLVQYESFLKTKVRSRTRLARNVAVLYPHIQRRTNDRFRLRKV